MEIRRATSADLVRRIRSHVQQEQGRYPHAMFTILIGAGVSIGAGMPSTALLVAAMRARRDALLARSGVREWAALLEDASRAVDSSGEAPIGLTAEYQSLFNDEDLFPSPPHRQRFISEAILWAANRTTPMSRESLFLGSILLAGAGRRPDSPPARREMDLSGWLAHTVYTTNFDEVLPQTFRYCGEPVIVVDHPGVHGRLQGDPRYPRVAYLHGCHLHYALRNTAAELARPDRDRSDGVDLSGLFLRFRDVLRGTGLIVLGYSGWNDRAVRAIRDALADDESLPYGLYWGARSGEKSLSDTALGLLRDHSERAYMLDEGKEAAVTLKTLCDELNVPHRENVARWSLRLDGVKSQFVSISVDRWVEVLIPPAHPGTPETTAEPTNALVGEFVQSRLVQEGRDVIDAFNRARVETWLDQADRFTKTLRQRGTQPNGDLLYYVGTARGMLGRFAEAIRDLEASHTQYEAEGSRVNAAMALTKKADWLNNLFRHGEAKAVALEAAERFRAENYTAGYVEATKAAAQAARNSSCLSEAESIAVAALPTAEGEGAWWRGQLLEEVGEVRLRAGRIPEAEEAADSALHLYESAVDLIGQSNVLTLLGNAARARHDLKTARSLFERALMVSSSIEETFGEINSRVGLARIEIAEHNGPAARAQLERVASACAKVECGDAMQEVAYLGAEAAAMEGRPGDHAKTVAHAAAALEKLGSTFVAFEARLAEARIHQQAGRKEAALATARKVHDDAERLGETLAERKAEQIVAELENAAA